MLIPEITFGNVVFNSHIGGGSYSTKLTDVLPDNIESYKDTLVKSGFTPVEERMLGTNAYYAYKKGNESLFLTYYPTVGEAVVVTDPDTKYFSFGCESGKPVTTASITQMDLKDFGLSYVIRLPDGRFVIIDGGREDFPEDAVNLKARLDVLSEGRPIKIALWFMTHPHLDHYRCFFGFMDKFASEVTVEYAMHAFPEPSENEIEKVPGLLDYDEMHHIRRFFEYLDRFGIPTLRCHTGQVYNVAGASFEFLYTPDNTFETPMKHFNRLSVTAMMTLEGTRVLWCADSQYQASNFTDIYGDYLKCDIIQVPHHGFHGGTDELFRLAAAPTIINPTFEDDCYGKICMKYNFNVNSWYSEVTRDYITGSNGDVTLPLPYTPRENGRALLDELLLKYAVTRDNIVHNY